MGSGRWGRGGGRGTGHGHGHGRGRGCGHGRGGRTGKLGVEPGRRTSQFKLESGGRGTHNKRRSGENPILEAASHPSVSGEKFTSEKIEDRSSSDEESDIVNDSACAYETLLESLQSRGGDFAQIYAQRKREEQGMSTSDEDEEGSDEDEEGSGSEHSYEEDKDGVATDVVNEVESMEDVLERDSVKQPKAKIKAQGLTESQVDSDSESERELALDGASGATTIDPFRLHLDCKLMEADIGSLSEKKKHFRLEREATGLVGVNWVTDALDFPQEEKEFANLSVKVRLRKTWKILNKEPQFGDFETAQQCQFFSYCNSYRDILYPRRPTFYMGPGKEDMQMTDAYLLHLLNHLFKSKDLVVKSQEKLSHAISNGVPLEEREPPRDQGFTRPKVLILLPIRSLALRVVKRMLELVPASQKASIEDEDRFLDEFGDGEEEVPEEDAGIEIAGMQAKEKSTSKPSDFQALFRGNNDDHFRFGIKFTRKSVKLYNDFYTSDIIIASPLGLVTRIEEAETEKGKDVDFLSSIEILVVDYADVSLMQNWSHVNTIIEHLNKIPIQQHGTDFMRIREWCLNGHARYYRQSIVLSSFVDAGINAMFHRTFVNFAGKLKLRCEYRGILSKVLLQVRHVYERVDCNSLVEIDDARFQFFVKQVFPQIKDSLQGGVMIFIRSYFDFVRIRNYLKSQNASFCLLGEYTKQSDISRARTWFYHGKRPMMLYSERAHFYHRYKIRGIKEIVFYSLPEHAEFYAEICNMIEGLENPTCTVIFSRFDTLQLERVVGTSRANKMLSAKNKTFMFC